MEKFIKLTDTAVPLPIENIDTDQIIPARFLKSTDKQGFGDNVFRDWRYDHEGNKNKDFVLNDPTYSGSILVAGDNFGCGSSREHAAWAIAGYGFKVVISSFFADIFRGNALNNGILPIQVTPEYLKELLQTIKDKPETQLTINLEDQVLSSPVGELEFDIDPYKKVCMINGYDDIDFLISKKDTIETFEREQTY
ncbi:3-isopropylmalate dehydratase small subunit [Leeuwenhoekiella sp. NPDC079379]|uniref:3-isopropylmalate dehydratase small subunit n=1 Tax=Leeuwenhoekiella sp. NPDC079379 TaxID=3364122 RepID=UPI0037C99786